MSVIPSWIPKNSTNRTRLDLTREALVSGFARTKRAYSIPLEVACQLLVGRWSQLAGCTGLSLSYESFVVGFSACRAVAAVSRKEHSALVCGG